jgi:hypothetical protein
LGGAPVQPQPQRPETGRRPRREIELADQDRKFVISQVTAKKTTAAPKIIPIVY